MLHNVVILYSKRHNAHRDAHLGLWNKAIIIPYLQLVSHTPIRFGVFCRLILYLRCFVRQYIYIYLNFGYEGGALLGRSALSFLNPLTHRQVQTPHLPNTPAHPPLHKASARCAIRSSLVRSCGTPWDSAGCAISGHPPHEAVIHKESRGACDFFTTACGAPTARSWRPQAPKRNP